jgi:hypothetical protein
MGPCPEVRTYCNGESRDSTDEEHGHRGI